MTDTTEKKLPLDGVRVIDVATIIAAPYCAAILGEFGAEVLKVEHPVGGDACRKFGTPTKRGDTLTWLSESRNKKSVTIDLHRPEGVEVFKNLVAQTDIVCENFRPGTLERWGIGWDVLRKVNPGLIMLRVSGYGQTGPYKNRPGFARIAHAVGGIAYLSGMPKGTPVTPGSTTLGDYMSGLYGCVGVLMALRYKEKTGKGQYIDTALYESVFRCTEELAPIYAMFGTVRERHGPHIESACPYGHFPTKDGGWVAIACTTDKLFAPSRRGHGAPGIGVDLALWLAVGKDCQQGRRQRDRQGLVRFIEPRRGVGALQRVRGAGRTFEQHPRHLRQPAVPRPSQHGGI